jgi:formate dehydrogenase major subunit
VVLPIAAFGEDVGSVTSQEGRVQRWNACVPAPGEARAAWRVLRDLLAGLGASFAPASLDDVSRAIQQAVPQYAPCGPEAVARNGGVLLAPCEDGAPVAPSARRPSGGVHARASDAAPSLPDGWLLRREGAFDWNEDYQVMSSPTLRRSPAADRKLHPEGFVAMNTDDAGQLGVREGWCVHIRSALGAADVPVTLRSDQERRALFVPYAHRERLAAVTGESGVVEVEVSLA